MGIHEGNSIVTDSYLPLESYLTNYSLCTISTTEKLATDFLNGAGKQLHRELVTQDQINEHTSYMTGEATEFYFVQPDKSFSMSVMCSEVRPDRSCFSETRPRV